MKNHLKFIFIMLLIGLISSCSSDDSGTPDIKYTAYKNQSDDLNADALQLHYVSDNNYYSLNFYGNFDENRNPASTSLIVYDDTGTKVNMIIDPVSKRITSLFTTINGVNSDVVMKFDYEGDTKIKVSFHQYDWATNTSGSIFLTKIINTTANKKPFVITNPTEFSFLDNITALALGVAAAEIVSVIGGGWSAIGVLSGAAAALVASASAVAIVGAAAIAATVLFLNAASAAPLNISDLPPPSDIPLQNPVLPNNNPTNHLLPSPCFTTDISFEGSMDQFGSILISSVSGGVAPYTHMVGSQIQSNPVFANEYENGSYLLGVRDASGCISVKVLAFDREFDDVVGDWKLSKRIEENSQEETGEACAYNNILNLNSNSTFLGRNYKLTFDDCNLESQFSGNYTVVNSTLSLSNSAFGGPVSYEIALVSDTTMKLRYVQGQISVLETYTRQ